MKMYEMLNERTFKVADISALEDTRFYKASDIPNDNILLFNKTTTSTKNQLNDNEVLINLSNFKYAYRDEIEELENDKSCETQFKNLWAIASSKNKSLDEREKAIFDIAELFKSYEDKELSIIKF